MNLLSVYSIMMVASVFSAIVEKKACVRYIHTVLLSGVMTGNTTQWLADLAAKEMAASDMRNRHHVQPLLTWTTNAAHPSHRILVEVYGDHSLAERTCQKWLARFKSGNFDFEDKERPRAPSKFKDEELEAIKSGSIAIIQNVGQRVDTLAVPHHRRPSRIFLAERLCCVFGGTS
ncbi:hypothetical protein LAZ67_5000936 [Cordylochernes scorpioides]|uniref:Mos1 transposase HTH domain-containing protein n=1 Tax=Cordylochernes scorpioides TaxID=51811 RepID=A0ABY6KIB2_9ARAC|nr:hypothetical protein LAZ67_5000936 [Cordylochernes scorpioides]